jgi:hypothetical protein
VTTPLNCAFSPVVHARPSLAARSSCARDENGKARSAAGSGRDVDAVTKNSDRLAYYEESDTKAVAWYGIKAGEGLEDSGYLFNGNSNTSVVHIDPDTRTGAPAA